VVFKKNFEEVHDKSIAAIGAVLKQFEDTRGISFSLTAREEVQRSDFVGRDLVIVLGGDGTLTSIAHSVGPDTPVMGVNSHPLDTDPNGSTGFFMDSDVRTFESDLAAALDGEAIVNLLPRLQAQIVTTSGNKIRSDPALNDLLIANTHQYQPSRYRLRRDADSTNAAIDMMQRSSGCLFSTFVGQGAWFRHVCAIEGATFDSGEIDDHYLFVARDLPRHERVADGSYYAWTDKTTLLNSDMHRGYIVADGWDEFHFTRGSSVSVGLTGPVLQLLTFREPFVKRVSDWLY
jgi:hypothetical protein